jgi:hypothetical protein
MANAQEEEFKHFGMDLEFLSLTAAEDPVSFRPGDESGVPCGRGVE